jgi:Protein of unknown function (DUF1552)
MSSAMPPGDLPVPDVAPLAEPAPSPKQHRRLVSRRAFTAGLGASLLAAPFVQLLAPRTARAAGGRAKRLVVVFNPNGTVPARWRPSGTETDFSFPAGSILEPLAAQKDRLIILDGLQFTNASNHEGGMVAMLTANGRATDASRGMSIDQFVAAGIGAATRLPSLELGVQTSAWGAGPQTRMAYTAPGVYAPPDDDPISVFNRVFSTSSAPPTAQDPQVRRRKSVLDAVLGDLADLRSRVGVEEQQKLDQHLSSLRDLERTLGIDSSTVACTGGTAPAAIDNQANPNMPVVGKSQMDLLVAALACGATNVASLQWAFTVAPHVLSWLNITDGHHSLSHNGDADTVGVGNFVACERWFAQQFGYLLDRLAATPDPAGGTLLDSTLVLWAKEMGDSRLHVCTEVPMVLAGGGAFTPGRYLQLNGDSHVHLHVSICQAMGLTNDTFGNPDFGSGPLAGL